MTDQPIHFPPPAGTWGTVTRALVPNPRWRWWAFWQPRTIAVPVPAREIRMEPIDPASLPQLAGDLEANVTLASCPHDSKLDVTTFADCAAWRVFRCPTCGAEIRERRNPSPSPDSP